MLMVKLGLEEKVLGSPEEKRILTERAAKFSEQDLIRFFDMLLRLESELRWTSQPRFHLEVGFIKLAKVGHVRDIEDILREVKAGEVPTQRKPQTEPPVRAHQRAREEQTSANAPRQPVTAKEEAR